MSAKKKTEVKKRSRRVMKRVVEFEFSLKAARGIAEGLSYVKRGDTFTVDFTPTDATVFTTLFFKIKK